MHVKIVIALEAAYLINVLKPNVAFTHPRLPFPERSGQWICMAQLSAIGKTLSQRKGLAKYINSMHSL